MKCPYCDGTGTLGAEHSHVGALVLMRRKAVGLTQEQLASKAQLSRGQIANLEVGRTDIPIKTLARIAAALDCSMKDLVP